MKKEIVYDVDYFINKFSDIPEDNWCTKTYHEGHKHCAYGHCKAANEDIWLYEISRKYIESVSLVNDGYDIKYQQPTPKQRILAALYDIKKLQSKETEEKRIDITKELAVI